MGQLVQAELPAAEEYWLAWQMVHADAAEEAYCPEAHVTHKVAPAAPEAVPAGQFIQAELPAAVEYWPERQLEQTEPPDANWPAAQYEKQEAEVVAAV